MASKIKVDEIRGSTGSTITVPTGQTFTVTDGIPVASGGTGLASFTAGDILYATGATTLTKLGKGTTEQTFKMNTAAALPEWGTANEIAGGTGQTAFVAGDILYASGANTLSRLAKGVDAQVLKLSAGVPAWGAGAAETIQQVVQTVFKDATSSTASNGTFENITGATATITPTSTSNKVWVNAMITTGTQTYGVFLKIQKGGSDIAGALGTGLGSNRTGITAMSIGGTSDSAEMQSTNISYIDSPSTTSATTYTIQGSANAGNTWTVNYPYSDGDADYHGHSISTITLIEVGV